MIEGKSDFMGICFWFSLLCDAKPTGWRLVIVVKIDGVMVYMPIGLVESGLKIRVSWE